MFTLFRAKRVKLPRLFQERRILGDIIDHHDREETTEHRASFMKSEAERARWLQLGAVWEHSDLGGYQMVLEAPSVVFNTWLTLRRKIEERYRE